MSVEPSSLEASGLPAWRNPAAWTRTADVIAVLIAVSLPWSTSLVSILVVIWMIAIIPEIDIQALLRSLRRPICALPIALFTLALIGTTWSTAPWLTRLYYVGPTAKLIVLPLLIYHFERSPRGMKIFAAFLASCSVLLLLSWFSYFNPPYFYRVTSDLGLPRKVFIIGLPVKNYITQSQEFLLCTFGCAIAAFVAWQAKRIWTAIAFASLGAAFLLNLLVVISARTAFVCIPVLLLVFMFQHLSRHTLLPFAIAAILGVAVVWTASPYLRWRINHAITEYSEYKSENQMTSSGERLEFWRKSAKFFLEAPLIGHGTGSTQSLFEKDAIGKTKASAEVTANPHNQTLYFAVQWGIIGVALLFAMWTVHFLKFLGTGWGAWLGMIVVTQNIVGSVFNSHISDFVEGWIYVIGVGVAVGMISRSRKPEWVAATTT